MGKPMKYHCGHFIYVSDALADWLERAYCPHGPEALRLIVDHIHEILRPYEAKLEAYKAAHVLVIDSLHDAQARCSCGKWNLSMPGPASRAQIQEKHDIHTRRTS